MKTKKLLQTIGLTILMMFLTTLFTNAQIAVQGLAADHEGTAVWDADGTGPEPAATGHIHPYGWGTCRYYGASRDYDNIDPDPDAALCHFQDDINGFPLFEQALANNGFTPGQVKMKTGLLSLKNDIEGDDWFTFDDKHFFNYYDAYGLIELNGEPMVSFYINYYFDWIASTSDSWHLQSTFSKPYDVSGSGSTAVQEVAAAFMADLNRQELRLVVDDLQSVEVFGTVNGRINGVYHEIVSGHLEKGFPELPFTGLAADHEGIAGWNADGSGPEPEATGHSFTYNGTLYQYSYYWASRDYDGIDPDPNAGSVHFTGIGTGFPNLDIQLQYRGYTIDQIQAKQTISTFGNDIEGEDWWLDGCMHYWHSYGNIGTLELAGEPILQYVTDTNFCSQNMDIIDNWQLYTNYLKLIDISANASADAQHVALSFLKDLGGHAIKTTGEGNFAGYMSSLNGREGVFHEISSGLITAKLPEGTLIWDHEIWDTLFLEQSPYVFMDYCEVPDGKILVIEPGVVVKFNTTKAFIVNGCIKAEGTTEQPIVFRAINQNVRWGGLMWDQTPVTNDTSIVKHCIFEYAYSYETEPGYNCGGALRTNIDKLKISHCTFRNNLADNMAPSNCCGGAVAIFECSPYISHCTFYNNSSTWGGALAVCSNSNSVIDNCLFYDNESTYSGGGGGAVLIWSESNAHFVNCTFADNYAVDAGGAVEIEINSTGTFTNCIFWDNEADNGVDQISVWDPANSFLNVYYSDIKEGTNGITSGFQGDTLNILNLDPEFKGMGEFPYALNPDNNSPCIDEGTLDPLYLPAGWICPSFCLCGNPRVSGPGIDMGCYEALQVGINESVGADIFSFKIFPNPINSPPSLEFYLENETSVQLIILDIHGRVIYDMETSELQTGNNHIRWNAGNISPGVYFCRLQIGSEILTKKVVKIE